MLQWPNRLFLILSALTTPGNSCQCDSACAAKGSCCSDKVSVCG